MRTLAVLAVVVPALLAAAASAAGFAQSLPEPRDFKPARIAVVDITEIFENYSKKKEIEARLDVEIKGEEKKLQDLDQELKALAQELKNVDGGSDKEKELVIKKTRLDYEMKNRQKELLREFREKQFNALKEIRNEITRDIEMYAASLEIDLVVEKKVSAEGKGEVPAVHWPIVHFARPELDITADIVKRLNAKHGKPAPAVKKQGG